MIVPIGILHNGGQEADSQGDETTGKRVRV
jgi:hypothetical protein